MSLPVEQLANAFRELKVELEATRAETKELRQLLQAAKSEAKDRENNNWGGGAPHPSPRLPHPR